MTTLAVSTGLDSFGNPEEIGPMYPFVGLEWLFVVIAVVLWLGWHVLQARAETREERRAVEKYERLGIDRVMYHGASALAVTDEEWLAEQRAGGELPPGTRPS